MTQKKRPDFAMIIAQLEDGKTLADCDEALDHILEASRKAGKAGSLTIALVIEAQARGFTVVPEVRVKLPSASREGLTIDSAGQQPGFFPEQ